MALQANRTLVKSPPELWELADDGGLMGRWCASLAGRREPPDVRVTRRKAGERLAWRSASGDVGVELSFTEKGFGTSVSISVACVREVPPDSIEALLDELGSPQRRPFTRA